jgi:EmrB/QacA subfamily drug resistance transporter
LADTEIRLMTQFARASRDDGRARDAEAPPATVGTRRAVLAATVLGSSLGFIDGSVVNIALPALQSSLGASAAIVQWVINAYLLLLGALVLVGGAAADRYGRRRVFVVGVILFAVASLACALAPTAAFLVAARAVQGFAAALMTPASLALVGATFSADERPRAFGIWAGAGALTTAFAPVLGGWLVDTVGWRAIFLLNLPLAAIAVVIALWRVPESRDDAAQPLDWAGAFLAALALGALTFGLTIAPVRGWSGPTLGWVIGGVVLLAGFLLLEQRSRAPMLPLALFGSRAFSALNAMTLLLYFALGGMMFLLPFELIRVEGYSTTAAGSALLPFAIVMGAFSSAAGRLARRIGERVQLTIGPIVAGVGIAWLGLTATGASYWTTRLPALLVLAVGMTLTVGPLTAAVMTAVEERHAGLASGVNNAVARIAALLAVAVMTIIVAGSAASTSADVLAATDRAAFHRGFRAAMIVAAACAAFGGVLVGATLGRSARVAMPRA